MLKHYFEQDTTPQRVVIIGSGGFIGKATSEKLSENGVTLKNIKREDVDLLHHNAAEKLSSLIHPSDIIVATSAIAPCKTPEMLKDNIIIATAISKAIAESDVSHVINISSDAVYMDDTNPLKETSITAPDSLHGIMHLSREIIFSNIIKAPLASVRPTLVYGEGDTHNGYGPNQFKNLVLSNQSISLFGEGEEERDHVFIDDVAEIIYRIILRRSYGVVNIASGSVVSFNYIAKKCVNLSGKNINIESRNRIGPMPHNGYRPFDISLYKTVFPDFLPTQFDDGIKKLFSK